MLAPIDNRAAALGPSAFTWWKDWRGQAVAIIASGPSLRKDDARKLHGRLPVLAIKRNVELAPWADVVYGCDAPWWESVRGLPDFKGLRLAYDHRIFEKYPDIQRIKLSSPKGSDLRFSEPGVIGSGGNSGFQALNIATQFGAKRVLLLGFDMSDRSGVHWYGRNNWMGANNPDGNNFRNWQRAFVVAAGQLGQLGVEVVNASGYSELTCFPRGKVDETLERWGT